MTSGGLVVHVNRIESAAAVTYGDVVGAAMAVAEAEQLKGGEISITFLDVNAISALNETHLDREGPTDVIAFNLGDRRAPLGDIYICPDVARESAAEYGVPYREELLRLVIHGMLHVVGHDHPEGAAREDCEMYRRQEEILSQLL